MLLKSTYEIPDDLVQSVLSALNALGYNSTSSISSAFGALGYTTTPSTLDTFSFAIDVRGIRIFNGEFAVKVIEAIKVIDINRRGGISDLLQLCSSQYEKFMNRQYEKANSNT